MKASKVYILLAAFMVLSISALAQAAPLGPDTIAATGKGRHQNNSDPVSVQANAGNVTALVMTSIRTTQAWQGYYGNISGSIALDDANNQTLYDWSIPSPQGEIYASNGSIVSWSSIYCMNVSNARGYNSSAGGPVSIVYSTNGTAIEQRYGINYTDRDGLNETFNDTYTDSTGFSVGSIGIDVTDGCSMAHPFVDEAYSTSWQELLLSDNASIIFTSLIRDNADGFQSSAEAADFQMLVLENGHAGHENTLTNYYFFVELS